MLNIPKSKLRNYRDKAFSVVAPTEWNKLPPNVRSCKSVTQFKKSLKTHFFSRNEEQDKLFQKVLQNISKMDKALYQCSIITIIIIIIIIIINIIIIIIITIIIIIIKK